MDGICNCITPIMKLSSILGLLSIKVVRDNGKLRAEFNKFHIVLPITYVVTTTILIYELILSAPTLQKSKYGIGVLYIGVLFIFIANMLALYTIYFMNTMASASIAKLMNKLSKTDELMKVMVNKIDYKSHFSYEVYVIGGGLSVVLVQIILHYLTFNSEQKLLNGRLLFLLGFPVIIRIVLEFQYTLFVKLLRDRFVVLNKELYDLFEHGSEKYKRYNTLSIQTIPKTNYKEWTAEEQKYTQLKTVELFMIVHDTLSEIGNTISRVYSLQILSCVATHLISEIFMIFYAYFEMAYHHYLPALHWFGWIITINLEMLQITAICHQTTNEASKTASVINKLFLVTQLKKVVKEKLFIFYQQIHHRPVQFSACGLFSINGGLLFMVTCASSTYLLIMFQYQEGIEMHCLNRNTT